MQFVMLGGPGAGKSTQSQQLSHHLNIPVISTGAILREAISAQTSLGLKAQSYVEKGKLLPDEIMIQFVRKRLLKSDTKQGWILEGYPRTAFQAEELDFLLEELEQSLNWAIYLNVSESVMRERSMARSLFDDRPEIIERRIAAFKERTVPILEYYEGTNRLLNIPAESSSHWVKATILKLI